MQKPHLFFRNPKDGVVALKQRPRYSESGKEEEENIVERNYTFLQETLRNSSNVFSSEVTERDKNRNRSLQIPDKLDCILIDFFDYFNIGVFETRYRDDFGLSPVKYFEYNTVGLFAVADEEKFRVFFAEIDKFANSNDPQNDPSFNRNILYIKKFSFLSSERKIGTKELKEYVNLELIDNLELITKKIFPIEKSLLEYLQTRSISFKFNPEMNRLEIFNSHPQLITEIIDNFDVIQSVNSPLAGVVKPSPYNLPVKEYGFTINNIPQDLPVIGIIDTGISNQTPLVPLIINNGNEFDITGTGPTIDEADHGTSVAALSALGPSLIPDHMGSFNADAKLLSIKVLNGTSGFISQTDVINLIKSANAKYGVKIFVLTIGYSDCKELNTEISNYAYSLDVLAHDLDILIFISAGNNKDQTYFVRGNFVPYNYPDHFSTKNSTLCIPADSINNISCGATSGNFENFDYVKNISHGPEFPASYTPRFYIQKSHPFFKKTRYNHQFIKPDLCYNAGDYDRVDLLPDDFGIKVVSADPGTFYSRIVGTSFSAPLLANLAAKIIQLYPELKMQSVKALLMNSALVPKCGDFLRNIPECKIEHVMGRGIPDAIKCIYSDENRITLILEDSIEPDEFKSYPIKLPEYLNNLNKDRSLLNVSATLCFSVNPVQNSHLAYCPLNISFGFFKNIDIDAKDIDAKGKEIRTGLNGNKAANIQLKSTLRWSQDYYYKPKILSNSQKLSFTISKTDLISEENQIKLAIKCQKHKLLPEYLSPTYNDAHSFSICIMIEENSVKGKLSGKLYDEMIAINELEAIVKGDIELEADTDI